MNTSSNIYEVDFLISRKIINKKKFYLVKWLNYPINESTWEPLSHLYNVKNLVEEFDKKYPQTIRKEEFKEYIIKCKNRNRKKNFQKLDNDSNNSFLSKKTKRSSEESTESTNIEKNEVKLTEMDILEQKFKKYEYLKNEPLVEQIF